MRAAKIISQIISVNWRPWAPRFLAVAAFLLIWHVAAIQLQHADRALQNEDGLLPTPWKTLLTLKTLAQSGDLSVDVLASLRRVVIGYILGAFLGVGISIAGLLANPLKIALRQVIEILRPIPPIAFVPLAILWFGTGDNSAYFLVAFASFFPVFTSTLTAFENVEKKHVDSAKTLGARRFALIRHVYIPASMPTTLAGLRTALGIAWFVVIVAEMVGAQSGLGYFIQINRQFLNSANVVAGMLAIGLLGLSMNWLFAVLLLNLSHRARNELCLKMKRSIMPLWRHLRRGGSIHD